MTQHTDWVFANYQNSKQQVNSAMWLGRQTDWVFATQQSSRQQINCSMWLDQRNFIYMLHVNSVFPCIICSLLTWYYSFIVYRTSRWRNQSNATRFESWSSNKIWKGLFSLDLSIWMNLYYSWFLVVHSSLSHCLFSLSVSHTVPWFLVSQIVCVISR